MERIPEPELMLDPEQALAYARADFAEPHQRFVALLGERLPGLPDSGRALDLGCGPADVALRFLESHPGWRVDGLDGSAPMLALGRRSAEERGLSERLRLVEGVLPAEGPPDPPYDLVFSNSLLHHLHRPAVLWEAVRRFGRAGGPVFVMDLLRPESRARVEALVERHAAGEPEVLRRDFHHSLLAAFRPEELRAQLAEAGLEDLDLEVVSDRHLIVWGRIA